MDNGRSSGGGGVAGGRRGRPRRLRLVRAFEKRAHIVHLHTGAQNGVGIRDKLADPAGKPGDRPEIQHKIADRQAALQYQPDQIAVGQAVAQRHGQRAHHPGQGVPGLDFVQQRRIVLQQMLPQRQEPVGHPVQPHVLAGGGLVYGVLDVPHMPFQRRLLVPPALLIPAGGPERNKVDRAQPDQQQHHPGIQRRDDAGIEQKADRAGNHRKQIDQHHRGAGPVAVKNSVHGLLKTVQALGVLHLFVRAGKRPDHELIHIKCAHIIVLHILRP